MSATVHAHRCEACAANGDEVVWIHADSCKGVLQAHKCPKCQTVQWKQFLVQPSRLPGANQNAQGKISLDAVLGYILFAVVLAAVSYFAFVYVKKLRGIKNVATV